MNFLQTYRYVHFSKQYVIQGGEIATLHSLESNKRKQCQCYLLLYKAVESLFSNFWEGFSLIFLSYTKFGHETSHKSLLNTTQLLVPKCLKQNWGMKLWIRTSEQAPWELQSVKKKKKKIIVVAFLYPFHPIFFPLALLLLYQNKETWTRPKTELLNLKT